MVVGYNESSRVRDGSLGDAAGPSVGRTALRLYFGFLGWSSAAISASISANSASASSSRLRAFLYFGAGASDGAEVDVDGSEGWVCVRGLGGVGAAVALLFSDAGASLAQNKPIVMRTCDIYSMIELVVEFGP